MSEQSIAEVLETALAGHRALRLVALARLATIGPAAAEASPGLRSIHLDPDPEIRAGVYLALSAIATPSTETFDALAQALKMEADPSLRPLIAHAMEAVSRPSSP